MKAIFQLIRWQNLLFLALTLWLMEKMVVVPILDSVRFGKQIPSWLLCITILAVVLIAAGGYAINDYFDVKIDSINRPDKLIVTRQISKQQAMLCHQIMTACGMILGISASIVCHSWALAIIFIFVPGLMWFYSSSYKRQFIIGNLIVATATACSILVIAILNAAYLNLHYPSVMPYTNITNTIYLWVGGFALFSFLTTWIREIIKDLQDQAGDRELECHTLPIKLGDTATKIIVSLLIIITSTLLVYILRFLLPFDHSFTSASMQYFIFGYIIPICIELYLIFSASIPSDYRNAQLLMKIIMVIGVLFSIVIKFNYPIAAI